MDNNNFNGQYNEDNRKSRLAAGLLGIFLGSLGIHNFYLGYTTKAIIQLSCTIGGIILGTVGSLIIIGFIFYLVPAGIGIWGLIEGIMIIAGSIKTDAKGIPLKD